MAKTPLERFDMPLMPVTLGIFNSINIDKYPGAFLSLVLGEHTFTGNFLLG